MRDMGDVIVIGSIALCKGAQAVTPQVLNLASGVFAFHWYWECVSRLFRLLLREVHRRWPSRRGPGPSRSEIE